MAGDPRSAACLDQDGGGGHYRPGPARSWQTGAQKGQSNGPNAYEQSVFYQWYWISPTPPVVGPDVGDNHLVPSVDNAWLAARLITIREYAKANAHTALAQKAQHILGDMDFSIRARAGL